MLAEAFDLTGRVAVVTGGGRGLGRHMAKALARAGASVVIASRTVGQLQHVQAEIEAARGVALAVPTDVADSAQVNALVAATVERFGRLDIVVNNAGGSYPGASNLGSLTPLLDATDDHWRWGLETNLSSTFYVCRAAIPHLVRRGGGSIVNMSSGEGMRGGPHWEHAVAAGGNITLTKLLSAQYARDGVRVNCLAPGFIAAHLDRGDERQLAEMDEMTKRFNPVGRTGRGWEMEPLILFLASDASRYVTGQLFIIDGAGTAAGFAPAGYAPEVGLDG